MRFSSLVQLTACCALLGTAVCRPPATWAASEEELAQKQERQKQVQADTDAMVRRLGTMLRVLEYYQIDKTGERKVLEEMTGVLKGLSKSQMADVIRRLDAAAKAKLETAAGAEVQKAYDRHREILDTLQSLLARHDAIHDLAQAADRLDAAAKNQLELYLQTNQFTREPLDQAGFQPQQRFPAGKRRFGPTESQRQGDAQLEIERDVSRVLQEVADLKHALPAEQQSRVVLVQKLAAEQRLVDNLVQVARRLKASVQRTPAWKEANAVQCQAVSQIKELARALRDPADALAALREA
ncbi:MAG TPA: hypothetical protein VGX76_00505, partial [Pirellulales bacterium]|nr:hypothetical protein [Pirellulales bacterium]